MDQPNTTTVTQTQLEATQVPQTAEESPDSNCRICLEPLDTIRIGTCIRCPARYHSFCLQEWLVNDPSLPRLPHATLRYHWDFNKSRCPNCRKEHPNPSIAVDLQQNLKNFVLYLKNNCNSFIMQIEHDVAKKGENMALQLFREGKSVGNIRSEVYYSRIVDRILKNYGKNFSDFFQSSLKAILRKEILTDFVAECKPQLMSECYAEKQRYVRGMMFSTKESLFILLFDYKLAENQEKAFQYINRQMKQFALENIVEHQYPAENSEMFDQIAREAHTQYSASNTIYYSNMRIACADGLTSQEKELLSMRHSEIKNKLSLSDIRQQVSDFYLLNKMKFETSGEDAWTSHASKVIADAARAPPSEEWVLSADELTSRMRTRSQQLEELSNALPNDSLVVPAAEPAPKRMRTRSQGPPEA